ncbi:MAG: type II secretion system F family protein [Phycisphaerales bacterium]|nr:type II secretion system F family protein [Phycisphaerales bacterium]MCI0631631.1 type II secretion system F family protein [Phycisphaerales bacterium]MCI0675383.1 type II secretion system F family protein [Phycisphaerales bacterium]
MSELAFQYQAIDRKGGKTKGVLRASDRNDAYRQVRAAGLQPLNIKAVRSREGRRKRVTIKDLSHVTYQFSVLLEARISIIDGLRSIAEQENNHRLRRVLNDVADRIAAGASVTDAIGTYRDLFGEVYVETVRAAEASGNMTLILSSLAEMLDRQYEISKNVKGALMYPICVIAALCLAVLFLMLFVVPKFGTMFAARGIELPVPTKILIGFSDFVRTYWYAILGGGFGLFWSVRKSWRNPITRRKMDTFMHRVPFLRSVLKGVAISRFANVLGISLRSGLNLMQSLEMAGRASGRPLMVADAEKMREQVNLGGRLVDVLLTCSYLPAFTKRMLAAGEEAAELPKMCAVVARHYDREVTHLTKNVTTVIEPIMIVGLAGVVLLVALAIFLPMWNMTALIG